MLTFLLKNISLKNLLALKEVRNAVNFVTAKETTRTLEVFCNKIKLGNQKTINPFLTYHKFHQKWYLPVKKNKINKRIKTNRI